MTDIQTEFKMDILKRLVNWLTPRIIKKIGDVRPTKPQSLIVERAWSRLEAVLEKEVATGCFDDKNFRNLLIATERALIFLCENDKYYKRWLGLAMLFMFEEIGRSRADFDFHEAEASCPRPMLLKFTEYIANVDPLWKNHMTGYLYALSKTDSDVIAEILEARKNRSHVDIPSRDPKAFWRLFFAGKTDDPINTGFTLMFRDRHVPSINESREIREKIHG